MTKLICECCGGDIDPKTATCRYCDTVYLSAYIKERVNTVYDTDMQPICELQSARAAVDILTPNEMRELYGLCKLDCGHHTVVEKYYETKRDSEVITAQMRVQDLYDSALKSMREYAYGTRERRGFQ